jgi:hypothetical protein
MKLSLGLASAPVVKEGRQTLPSGYLLQVSAGSIPQLHKNVSAFQKKQRLTANDVVAAVLGSIPCVLRHRGF